MRKILLIVVLGGCSQTRDVQRPSQDRTTDAASQKIPVVNEPPSLFTRQRVNRQQTASDEGMAMTEVQGDVTK